MANHKGGEEMLGVDRQQLILSEIKEKGSVKISALMKTFTASESTIRRDLEELERQGWIKRVHGGAILLQHMTVEPSNTDKSILFAEEKEAIGKLAAELVEEHASLIVDAGTTTAAFARHLQTPNLKILTNAMNIADILSAKQYNVLVSGGLLKPTTNAMVGETAIETLSHFRADLCFLAMNGISDEDGLTTPDLQEAWVKKAMIRSARKVILLADSSKFGRTTFTRVADIQAVHTVVTDDGISEEDRAWLEKHGIEVKIASKE
jgi:DeoR family fructose operon transcriptional repressor